MQASRIRAGMSPPPAMRASLGRDVVIRLRLADTALRGIADEIRHLADQRRSGVGFGHVVQALGEGAFAGKQLVVSDAQLADILTLETAPLEAAEAQPGHHNGSASGRERVGKYG